MWCLGEKQKNHKTPRTVVVFRWIFFEKSAKNMRNFARKY